ncbi:DUF4245 domain-containing protein [Janibacter sp. G56]|uniref:DUF4245 domain-containing protein n=1 Tax=Janibacter sp. G56 TaxID=3418717 RepID=UPI003CFFACAE
MSSQSPTPTGPAPRSHYANGTAGNVIRSMLVIGALVAIVYLAIARTETVQRQSIDVALAAQSASEQTDWPIEVPTGLDEEWSATLARFAATDEPPTWRVGYQSGHDTHVAYAQAKDAPATWVTEQLRGASGDGSVTTPDGREWQRHISEDGQTRLLTQVPPGRKGLTTVLRGTGAWDEVVDFAGHLSPAVGAGASSSGG